MTYFPKDVVNGYQSLIPSVVLPLVYEDYKNGKGTNELEKFWRDEQGNARSEEIPSVVYFACWRVSNLMIADLIEDKLGYNKDELKVSDQLSSYLGTDSLDLVKIAIYLEKAAGIPLHEGLEFKNVSELIDYVFSIMVRKVKKLTLAWPKTA